MHRDSYHHKHTRSKNTIIPCSRCAQIAHSQRLSDDLSSQNHTKTATTHTFSTNTLQLNSNLDSQRSHALKLVHVVRTLSQRICMHWARRVSFQHVSRAVRHRPPSSILIWCSSRLALFRDVIRIRCEVRSTDATGSITG